MPTEVQTTKRRQCHAIAAELSLTREERHEFAEMFLKVDCSSWNGLSDAQMERLADGLVGAEYVIALLRQRP